MDKPRIIDELAGVATSDSSRFHGIGLPMARGRSVVRKLPDRHETRVEAGSGIGRKDRQVPARAIDRLSDPLNLSLLQRTAGNAATEQYLRGAGSTIQRQPRVQRLRDRVLHRDLDLVADYEGLREQVERWLSRWVMSDEPAMLPSGRVGPALYRERGLVSSSNLRDLHRRILANESAGTSIRVRARLQAGRDRYEGLVFDVPGRTFLEVTTIAGTAIDRQRVQAEINELGAVREQQLGRTRRQIRHAIEATQHAVLEGSVRYRPTESGARDLRKLETLEQILRMIDHPEPMEAGVDYRVRMAAIRSLEEYADRELAKARLELQRLGELDERLRRLHRDIGSDYQPEEEPQLPDARRAGRFDEEPARRRSGREPQGQ